jgi:hypothetical protein
MASNLTNAQKDTSSFKLSALQFDLAVPIGPNTVFIDQGDLKNSIAQDTFLYKDLSGYQEFANVGYYRNHFTLLAGVKVFYQREKSKGGPEFYLGCRYGQTNVGGSYYQKVLLDSSSTLIDPQTGKVITTTWKTTRAYSFSIWDHRIYLPFGANLKTDDSKMLWMNFGLELCPIFSFGQKFTSAKSQNEVVRFFEQGSATNVMGLSGTTLVNADQKMKSLGFGLYAGCPMNLYFQPFIKLKRKTKLKGLNLCVGVTPLYFASKVTFLPIQTGMKLNYSAGIRWRLSANS